MDQKTKKFMEQAANILQSMPEDTYGKKFRGDFLTQYRDYVGSADHISSRREKANGFFLAINTGFIGAQGYFEIISIQASYVQALVGLMFCFLWRRMIQSYKTLNDSKFDVIQMMEKSLPLAPYTAEEFVQDNGPGDHRALTSVEKYVPGIFAVLHILSLVFLVIVK